MSIAILRNSTALLLTLTLGACGGGGGGGGGGETTDPLNTRGFAQPGWVIEEGVVFRPPNVTIMITRDQGETLDILNDGDVTFEFNENAAGDEVIDFTIDGNTFRLVDDGSGDTWELPSSAGTAVMRLFLEYTSDNEAAEVYFLLNSIGRPTNPIYPENAVFVVGYATDPSTVTAENIAPVSGTATYNGSILANAVDADSTVFDNNGLQNVEEGAITLIADFNNGASISGEFELGNFDGDTTAETYIIPSVSINGNGFSGTFTVDDNELAPGQTLVGAEINGNFYGSDAGAIGGHIFTEIQEAGEETIYIQGAFLADEN